MNNIVRHCSNQTKSESKDSQHNYCSQVKGYSEDNDQSASSNLLGQLAFFFSLFFLEFAFAQARSSEKLIDGNNAIDKADAKNNKRHK